MKLITDERKRMTTFTKRRKDLFKKAQELSTLCGCEIAIVTLSRAGKSSAFASPPGADILCCYLSSKNNTIDKYDNLHHSQAVIDSCEDEHDLHQLKCAFETLKTESPPDFFFAIVSINIVSIVSTSGDTLLRHGH